MRVDVINIIHLACSNHCLHCGYGGRLNVADADRCTDFSRWLRYMDWAKDHRVRLVVFSGGDPTEHPRFRELVIEALWRELVVQVETHGQRFADVDALKCFGSGRRFSFVIPLHGATAGLHDRIVGRQGAFERTLRGIRNIRDCLSSRVACMSVIQSANVRCIPEIAELCYSLGAHQYFGTLVQPCGSAKSNEVDIVPSPKDIAWCVETTALLGEGGRLFFNNVPFCLMGQHCNLSINFPPSYPVGDAFELLCYPSDPRRDYIVLKTLFSKRPTCATCLPAACSRFMGRPSGTRCNSAQRHLMEEYCALCEGCFYQKVCPGLPLATVATSEMSALKRIGWSEGLDSMSIGEQQRPADADKPRS